MSEHKLVLTLMLAHDDALTYTWMHVDRKTLAFLYKVAKSRVYRTGRRRYAVGLLMTNGVTWTGVGKVILVPVFRPERRAPLMFTTDLHFALGVVESVNSGKSSLEQALTLLGGYSFEKLQEIINS